MAAGPNPATIAAYQRKLARRVESFARHAPGWSIVDRPRGQRTTALLRAPDGRRLELNWFVSRASNGETFVRPCWTAVYPGEQEACRLFRTAPDSRFVGAPRAGMAEAEALNHALHAPARARSGFAFRLAALRLLDAMQPLAEDVRPGWYAVRADVEADKWMVLATRPSMPGVVGSAYLPPAELVGFDIIADGPEHALRVALDKFTDPYGPEEA